MSECRNDADVLEAESTNATDGPFASPSRRCREACAARIPQAVLHHHAAFAGHSVESSLGGLATAVDRSAKVVAGAPHQRVAEAVRARTSLRVHSESPTGWDGDAVNRAGSGEGDCAGRLDGAVEIAEPALRTAEQERTLLAKPECDEHNEGARGERNDDVVRPATAL